jgi:hypothetical protein
MLELSLLQRKISQTLILNYYVPHFLDFLLPLVLTDHHHDLMIDLFV